MKVLLKGNCEKIKLSQNKEDKILYNDSEVEIKNNQSFSISSIATTEKVITNSIWFFPIQFILTIFDIIFMNFEWDWIDRFEPYVFNVPDLFYKEEKIEIQCNKSQYKKDMDTIVMPEVVINGSRIENIECHAYSMDLKLRFLKCCFKVVSMLIWNYIPLTIIMIGARNFVAKIFIVLIESALAIALVAKIRSEYVKYLKIKITEAQ